MSALADEIKAAMREVLREELPGALSQLQPRSDEGRDRLVGVTEAADRLGLSTSTIYKRAERCQLPSIRDGGRLLFKVGDLVSYAEQRRRSPERVRQLAERATRAHNVIQNVADNVRPKAQPDLPPPERK